MTRRSVFWSNIYSVCRRQLMTQPRARSMACNCTLEESADVGSRTFHQASQLASRISRLQCVLILAALSGTAFAALHPVPLDPKADSSTGIACHEDKTKGKSVHSAMAMGCTSCHEIRVNKDTTRVKLITIVPYKVCLTCHSDKDATHLKGRVHPPAVRECLTCHDPHSSEN